jgi:hypothetical protein
VSLSFVVPGLDPGIHVLLSEQRLRRGWPDKPGRDGEVILEAAYFTAEKRLSNEFAGTTGTAPDSVAGGGTADAV